MKTVNAGWRAGGFVGATAIFLQLGSNGCGLQAGSQLSGGRDGGSELTGLALDVATKANTVASQIGGPTGFGGMLMEGYREHMLENMGFHGADDLADADSDMGIRLTNDSTQDCTFHLAYFASHIGMAEQLMDVSVQAGDSLTISIPCSEIIGLGGLEAPGEAGCHLSDGEAVDNMMAVPGFFEQDFTCDETYACVLTSDVNDLDGDGDTEELIIVSDAMTFHMMNGGPSGHMHGNGPGMMGSHMGM
ncbi:hypothetical protein YTPLAS18_40270 [Nitrospira sp.]|nr:hypothetical protein YTPLAS18_40270 [Nitrospira sp.]